MGAVDVMDMLRRSGGIEAVSKQLGIPPAMASAGADALVPAILGGFGKHAGAAGGGDSGLGALIGMLGALGGGGLAANVLGPEATNVAKGNEVLGQIFGSKDVSRTVAADAAGKSGIEPAVLKKMLPILAMLVGGYLSARAGGSGAQGSGGLGGLGSILGSVLGGEKDGGGLGSLLDLDGDGNPLDDIIGMAGKLAR
jgi:hypothetical protein